MSSYFHQGRIFYIEYRKLSLFEWSKNHTQFHLSWQKNWDIYRWAFPFFYLHVSDELLYLQVYFNVTCKNANNDSSKEPKSERKNPKWFFGTEFDAHFCNFSRWSGQWINLTDFYIFLKGDLQSWLWTMFVCSKKLQLQIFVRSFILISMFFHTKTVFFSNSADLFYEF